MFVEFCKIGVDVYFIFNMYIVEDVIDDEFMVGYFDGYDFVYVYEDVGVEFFFVRARFVERDWFERAFWFFLIIEIFFGIGYFSECKVYFIVIGCVDLFLILFIV